MDKQFGAEGKLGIAGGGLVSEESQQNHCVEAPVDTGYVYPRRPTGRHRFMSRYSYMGQTQNVDSCLPMFMSATTHALDIFWFPLTGTRGRGVYHVSTSGNGSRQRPNVNEPLQRTHVDEPLLTCVYGGPQRSEFRTASPLNLLSIYIGRKNALPHLQIALKDRNNFDADIQLAYLTSDLSLSVQLLDPRSLSRLGADRFDDNGRCVGKFGDSGLLLTRPYMRVLQGLVRMCFDAKQYEKAALTIIETLRLNPSDELYQRWWLASLLIRTGRFADALFFCQLWIPRDVDRSVGTPIRGGTAFVAPSDKLLPPETEEKLRSSFASRRARIPVFSLTLWPGGRDQPKANSAPHEQPRRGTRLFVDRSGSVDGAGCVELGRILRSQLPKDGLEEAQSLYALSFPALYHVFDILYVADCNQTFGKTKQWTLSTHHLVCDPIGIDVLVPTREVANEYLLSNM
ncbi:hypothetical protein DFH09DRAFT_1070321 [Mycena vulgaris]|nr:hypothetical protein DFH09DRAFT_1070321 [Mycena vulgaris]